MLIMCPVEVCERAESVQFLWQDAPAPNCVGGKNGTRPDKKLNLVFQSVIIINRGCFSLISYVLGGVDVIGQHI